MKKFVSFFLLFSVLLLTGCSQKDLIDIYVFSDRFSGHSETFNIDTDAFMASEEKGEIVFPITFNDKFLLTIRVNEETSLISQISVVCLCNKNKTITERDFDNFCEIVDCAIKAFTNLENTEDIFSNLSLGKLDNISENTHLHYEKGFYKYSLFLNEVGIYFSASTERR